jgi:hypothetical protein
MNKRMLVLLLGSLCFITGRGDACCTVPEVMIWNWLHWVVPGYELELTAEDEAGTCLSYWWWNSAGGYMSIVGDHNGCWECPVIPSEGFPSIVSVRTILMPMPAMTVGEAQIPPMSTYVQ